MFSDTSRATSVQEPAALGPAPAAGPAVGPADCAFPEGRRGCRERSRARLPCRPGVWGQQSQEAGPRSRRLQWSRAWPGAVASGSRLRRPPVRPPPAHPAGAGSGVVVPERRTGRGLRCFYRSGHGAFRVSVVLLGPSAGSGNRLDVAPVARGWGPSFRCPEARRGPRRAAPEPLPCVLSTRSGVFPRPRGQGGGRRHAGRRRSGRCRRSLAEACRSEASSEHV